MRVLIVSLDQSRLRISLHLALRSQGFIVDAAWVEDAEPYVLDYQYDIIIAAAAGRSGPNTDYVFNTVQHLQDMGIRDSLLESIAANVGALVAQPAVDSLP